MILSRMVDRLRRWRRSEAGNATVEFVMIFPFIMWFFCSSIEVSFYLVRAVLLDRAVDLNVRELRLGTLNPATSAQLKTQICNDSLIFSDCVQNMVIELTPVQTTNWNLPDARVQCVDRDANIQPVVTFDPGQINDLMVVRACVVLNPFFAPTKWVMNLPLDPSGGVRIAAASTFVNEP